ncbi:hypothetical protein Goklo_024048 [Gossypium klotzschianum]|uniref:FBD domain-containing protein n=1 Tax=Gossypium klotzschianum TaxID=34286 RepID=A0A7J8W653_9ROSI|nr:hypothetical protein [Gossypium klotzschianum]
MLKWKRSWKYMFGKFKKLRVLSFEEGGEGYSRFKLSSAIDLSKFTKLRKLGILGPFNIHDFKEELDKNLPIIASDCLRSLSIWNDEGIDPKVLAHLLSSCVNLCELMIEKLPDFHHFSSSTAYVHLIRCMLVEDPMPTLEKLPNLRVMELYVYAFIGKEMVCSALHLPKLESLNLSGL